MVQPERADPWYEIANVVIGAAFAVGTLGATVIWQFMCQLVAIVITFINANGIMGFMGI